MSSRLRLFYVCEPQRSDRVAGCQLLLSHHYFSTKAEDDVVYLNIKENQMDGNMTTFFRYASEFAQFDYIAKVDDDTLFFPANLLDAIFTKSCQTVSRPWWLGNECILL
jgi:hypothetical protein